MLKFVSKPLKNKEGIFQHFVFQNDKLIDKFENRNEITNTELYVNEVGFPPTHEILEILREEGLLKDRIFLVKQK